MRASSLFLLKHFFACYQHKNNSFIECFMGTSNCVLSVIIAQHNMHIRNEQEKRIRDLMVKSLSALFGSFIYPFYRN